MKRYNSVKEEVTMMDPFDDSPFDYEEELEYSTAEDAYFFDDEESGLRYFYDPEFDEWYYYDIEDGVLTKEYETDFIEGDMMEGFTKEKPPAEAGYEIKKVKKAAPGGKVQIGYVKTKKKGVVKKKTKLSKSQLKLRAKKASRTKAKDVAGKKKAVKKAKKTRKLNINK